MEQGETAAAIHGPPPENNYNGQHQQVGGLMPPPHLRFVPCSGDGAISGVDGGAAVHAAAGFVGSGGGGFAGVAGSGGFAFGERPKKKMGRPRKYEVGERNALATVTQPPGFSITPSSSSDLSKRRRGRPPGSRNREKPSPLGGLVPGAPGVSFTPYVTTVQTGEDVLARILSFSLSGPRGVCVLSATGTVSNVTIRQPGSPSGATFSYEGRFEILSLMGSYVANDSGGRSTTGGLSVSLAGADGRVIGGAVAGVLRAATPIQMVVGSFVTGSFKVKRKYQRRVHNYSISQTRQDGSMIPSSIAPPTSAAGAGVPTNMISSPVINSQSQSQSQSHSQSQSQDETSDDSRSMQNLNMEPSSYMMGPERNGLGHRFSQNTSPDINVFPPSEH